MFFVFLVLELLIFSYFSDTYGFLLTFAGYILPSFLGALLILFNGVFSVANFQQKILAGESLDKSLMRTAANVLAGVLLILPTFLTRIAAVLLLLPGMRQLIFIMITRRFSNKIYTHVHTSTNFQNNSHNFRDVHEAKVIEIEKKP